MSEITRIIDEYHKGDTMKINCRYCDVYFEQSKEYIRHLWEEHDSYAALASTYCENCGMEWKHIIKYNRKAINYCPTCGNELGIYNG